MTHSLDLADLRVSMEMHSAVGAGDPGDLAVSWRSTLSVTDDEGRSIEEVAKAELWIVEDGEFAADEILDAVSADLAKYVELYDDAELSDDLELGGFGDGLVVVDRVSVPPGHRGRGYGPLLVAESLSVLAAGRAVVACEPAPFELKQDSAEWEPEKQRLERLWGDFGFKPWRSGIWYLDPATVVLDDTRSGLHARFR